VIADCTAPADPANVTNVCAEPIRLSDAEREQAVVMLREHLLAGRLTLEEFTDRVGAALQARFDRDLASVRQDLPAVPVPGGAGHRSVRLTAALFGHVARRGPLRLRRWTVAASAFGDLDLDLRDATTDRGQVVIAVVAVLGNIDVYVPEGVNVQVSGLAAFGHRRDWGRGTDRPDAPTVHVQALGFAGTIDVWRVPHDMHDSSYGEIMRRLHPRPGRPA